ncbi:hypothetical protein V8O70_003872 [Escherichia coli]|nr:hypothetical protein [Escherichia coli]
MFIAGSLSSRRRRPAGLVSAICIDMPAGHGHMTLEFSVSAWLMNNWYPTASISDLLVVVMKKATAGISIS